MSRLGFKTVVHHGELRLGELEAIPTRDQNFQFPSNEIRIRHISQKTERSPPLAVLQTISSFSVLCKLESTLPVEQPHLINLHACCYYEGKTAVAVVGDQEIHLVAMPSKQKKFPCFWCYSVPLGLYSACLGMLNMRCLSIVFDLDETLIVANTMKSFDDRIDALRSWIGREVDEMRIAGMSAEMKRYAEDRALLKQYIDNDSVADNAKVFKIQLEEVPPVSENHEKIVRPIIRMPEKNIVLTRINPEIRDTSVLVRLRPAWEDLRSYLIAKGRKRFEVYVCTMAERDYALEMWRLLDPEAHLIGSKQLKDRVVCVKPDSRKSLLNVFQHGVCHPKMAMVIDDRSKVWEDKDQPRVHVVPAFTPYYAPQAETASPVPILCVARNVACNVRGSFFRDFDELLLRKFNEVFYEDDIVNLPPALDVSNYLMPEDTGPALNGNTNAPIREGMNGSEVEQRLNQANDKGGMESVAHFMKNHAEVRYQNSQAPVTNFPHVVGVAPLRPVLPSQKPGLRPPVRRDFFYDRDYDMKRGLIGTNSTLDRGQNSAEAPVQSRVSVQTPPSSSVRAQGGWLVDDVQQPDGLKLETRNPFTPFTPGSTPTGLLAHKSDVKREEVSSGRDLQKQNLSLPSQLSEASVSHNQASSLNRESYIEFGKVNPSASLSISALQEIARMCSSKIEFRSVLNTSNDLQFSVEVLLTGEKVGFGMGRTRKDAQQQAAENALLSLSDNYVAFITPRAGAVDRDVDKGSENGFLLDVNGPGSAQLLREGGLPKESTSEAAEVEPGHPITVSQKGQKRASSPRFLQSGGPNKRSKEDIP